MSSPGTNNTIFRLQVQGDREVVTKFKQVATSMQQLQPAAQKAAQSTTQVGTALKSTGQSANSSSTGLKSYNGALTSLGSANSSARTSTDSFTGSLGTFNKTNTVAVGGLNETNTVVKGLVPTMGNMGNETTKTGGKMQSLTNVFRGNRGLIFSVTMLSSGISEAISMFQGYQDASEKLAAAKQKVADLEERGMKNTKEYGEAVKDAQDAQRGFNFVQRFTIQSFADLIPMSLMLTSSIFDMTSKVGGFTAAKTKLAGVLPKVTQGIIAMGAAMRAFSLSHPLLLLLTALVAVALAIITNFMGVRDALNQIGVALGNAVGPLKGVLEWLGMVGNGAADTANSYLQFGQTATAATNDVEKQVLKSGDATKLTYQEQIALMHKLGDESKNIAFSLGAHLLQQQKDQEAHKSKYDQFVKAMQSGNSKIMQSLGLTSEEFKAFSEQMQEEIEAVDESFTTMVENITDNWDRFNETQADASTSLVKEINKLETEIVELTQQTWDMDDDDKIDETMQEVAQLTQKVWQLRGSISSAAMDAANDFTSLAETGKKALDQFSLEVLGGNFAGAINTLTHAMDQVPEKYRGNFDQIDSIIGNTALNNRQKVAQIIADYGSLEQAFKPLIVGAYELSRAEAEAAAGLDEVSAAARSNMTDMSQAEGAWNKFLSSLSPAQRDLPIIEDLIARIAAGELTFAEALAEAEAAGVSWSKVMGKDVVESIKNVEKSFIDMGDGTSAMVANVNGQMVNLGRVSNTELGNLSDDLGGVQTSMSDTSKSAKTELENEATMSVGVFGKDGKFHFGTVVQGANLVIDVFKAVNKYSDTYIVKGAGAKVVGFGTTMTNTGKTTKTETTNWATDFETFKTEAVKWLGEVQTALDNLWKSAKERLNNSNFQNLLPSFPEVGAEEDNNGSFLDTALKNGDNILNKNKSGIPGGMTEQQVKSLHKAWSTFSTSMAAYSTSIVASITKIQTAASTLSTSMATYANSMKVNIGSWATATVTVFGEVAKIVLLVQGTFSTFSTSIATYVTSMKTNIGSWAIASVTSMGEVSKIILVTQGVFSTFSTSVATYMNSMLTNIAKWGTVSITTFGEVSKLVFLTQGVFSTFSTSVATYMKSMTTNIGSWATSSTSSFNKVNTTIKTTHQSFSTMSTSVATYTKSMTSAISSFASSAVSNLNKVTSAANKATSAFNKMAAAARKAASAASRVGGLEHGGSFIASAQHGFSGIVNRPTTFKGVRMGEGFKPELVTVQPLTRGSGNHNGPTVSSNNNNNGGQPVINNITVVLDGRVIQRFVEKSVLNNIGFQV